MECVSITEFVLSIIGCINLLRGCLIFAIFVCKDSILDKVIYSMNNTYGTIYIQVGNLRLFGVKLSFMKRRNISHVDSVVSKGTSMASDAGINR